MKLLLTLIWQHARKRKGLMTLTLILVVLTSALWVLEPVYSSYAIDQLLGTLQGKTVSLAWIFGWWGVLFVALSVTQAFQKYFVWELDNTLHLGRREQVYEHVLHLGIAFHTKQKSGEVIKILEEGADNLLDLQRNFVLGLIPSMIASIVFLILSFTIQPILALILVIFIGLYIVVVVYGTKKTRVLQDEVNRLWVTSIGRAFDAVTNIFSVKSGAQEGREMELMKKAHEKTDEQQRKVNLRWAVIESINFFMLTRILLTGVGILLLIHNKLTLGQLYFFQFSFFRVLTPFEMLASLLPSWNKQVGKLRLSQEILETPIDVQSPAKAIKLENLKGEITLDKICFSYPQAQRFILEEEDEAIELELDPSDDAVRMEQVPQYHEHEPEGLSDQLPDSVEPAVIDKPKHAGEVLHEVTLDIKPGEHIALVGHSGAGKSTMAALLNRFYDVKTGKMLIDGVDIRQLDVRWWRSQIGLVLQENLMFNDTILNNIRYARPSASVDEVKEAARRAAAAEFIDELPQKYETMIGDRGIRLSGGQRQRVAIARAILKQPTIVVLDEATSALDSVTERKVQEGIKELIANRTSVIIAHRLSTVRSVDRIAVFDKGRLIACARHEELMKTTPIYREMVELQSQGMLAED